MIFNPLSKRQHKSKNQLKFQKFPKKSKIKNRELNYKPNQKKFCKNGFMIIMTTHTLVMNKKSN